MRASDRLGLAVTAAMALGLNALGPVTSDGRLFVDCLAMIVVVGLGGMLTRRLLPSDRSARLAQALLALAAFGLLAAGEGLANPFAVRDRLDGGARKGAATKERALRAHGGRRSSWSRP